MNPRLFINGEWRETGAWLPVFDPFDGSEIARVPLGGAAEIEAAAAAALAAGPVAAATPPHRRAAILHAAAAGIARRAGEFVEAILREAGKPITYAEAEVNRAVMTFTAAAEEARRQNGEVLDLDAFANGEGHTGFVRRFPVGVIAGITPFNFPLNLVAHKVAPAIASGNTIIVKPAPKCPLTALLMAEVLHEAGLPPGQLNVITCANEDAARLVADPRVAMISFTGSPAVGWPLKASAGRRKVCLELGGNAAVIIHADADVDAALPAITSGAFAYAGQTCISIQRILVHESRYGEFREKFAAFAAAKALAGSPQDRATMVGPMISSTAADRTRAHIASAVAAGARSLLPVPAGVARHFVPATILEDVPESHAVCKCELFAPVVTLHRYGDFDAALRMVNDSEFGLQCGIFTRDIQLALRAHDALHVGAVLINQVPTWRVENMPYGGVKDSGFGREGIRYAMEDMTEPRALIIRRG